MINRDTRAEIMASSILLLSIAEDRPSFADIPSFSFTEVSSKESRKSNGYTNIVSRSCMDSLDPLGDSCITKNREYEDPVNLKGWGSKITRRSYKKDLASLGQCGDGDSDIFVSKKYAQIRIYNSFDYKKASRDMSLQSKEYRRRNKSTSMKNDDWGYFIDSTTSTTRSN